MKIVKISFCQWLNEKRIFFHSYTYNCDTIVQEFVNSDGFVSTGKFRFSGEFIAVSCCYTLKNEKFILSFIFLFKYSSIWEDYSYILLL